MHQIHYIDDDLYYYVISDSFYTENNEFLSNINNALQALNKIRLEYIKEFNITIEQINELIKINKPVIDFIDYVQNAIQTQPDTNKALLRLDITDSDYAKSFPYFTRLIPFQEKLRFAIAHVYNQYKNELEGHDYLAGGRKHLLEDINTCIMEYEELLYLKNNNSAFNI